MARTDRTATRPSCLKIWPWYQNATGTRCSGVGLSNDEATSVECGTSFLMDWSLENCSDFSSESTFFGSGQMSHQLLEAFILLGALWYKSKLLLRSGSPTARSKLFTPAVACAACCQCIGYLPTVCLTAGGCRCKPKNYCNHGKDGAAKQKSKCPQ